MSLAIGLYLHIPFCRSKCAYCNFNSYAGLEGLIPSYVDALAREMGLWADQGLTAATIYLGGGTPSLLAPEQLRHLLEAAGHAFAIPPVAEATIEANPGTVDRAWLEAARRLGVNRLSLGVQSLDDSDLRLLSRIHTAGDATDTYLQAQQAGFANINLDLIYGLPGQKPARWQATLEAAIALGPQHFSLYPLTLEEDTPLTLAVAREEVPPPDPDLAADMYLLAEELLGQAGYHHYEISNWALPGHECRHNLTYWRNQPYLGLGAGGHSSWWGYRFNNTEQPEPYIRQVSRLSPTPGKPIEVLRSRSPVAGVEPIPRDLEMAETAIMGLRLLAGLDLEAFRRRFGVGLLDIYPGQVAELEALGLAELAEGHLHLTPHGCLLGNEAFWRFLPQVQ